MTIADEFREVLDEDVFSEIGKTVTLINETLPIYNSRDELEDSTEVSTSITAVPYNIVNSRQTHQTFGELDEGDMDMVVRYDQVIAIGNRVIIESVTYYVKEVQENYLPDNVATIVRLTKKEPIKADD